MTSYALQSTLFHFHVLTPLSPYWKFLEGIHIGNDIQAVKEALRTHWPEYQNLNRKDRGAIAYRVLKRRREHSGTRSNRPIPPVDAQHHPRNDSQPNSGTTAAGHGLESGSGLRADDSHPRDRALNTHAEPVSHALQYTTASDKNNTHQRDGQAPNP
ncbi:hypothetical protein BC567DRAFT_247842, partial [Phyllosticta citribraziliensis]